MADTLQPLIDDLLEWIGSARPYAEVMEAWRTSCPCLPVWEEANLRGLLDRRRNATGTVEVFLTERGLEQLRSSRQCAAPQ